MKEIIIGLFGQYQPLMQTVYHDTIMNGVEVSEMYQIPVDGIAGLDVTYIVGVALFAICLYSFFRILGAVISRV